MMTEIKFNKPQQVEMGDSLYLYIHGNLRRWIVCGYNALKTSIVVESTF
jgi:hypothetical protein